MRRNVLALTALLFVIGAVGFGQVFAWLLLPVLVLAARLSRVRTAG